MDKIFDWLHKSIEQIKGAYLSGIKWIGLDGLLNMETSALITIFLMIFFPVIWATVITFVMVMLKCILDKTRGRENEKHDLICALVGVLVGAILGPAHGALTSILK